MAHSSMDSSRIIDKCLLLKSTNSFCSICFASLATSSKSVFGGSFGVNGLLLLERNMLSFVDLDDFTIGEVGILLPDIFWSTALEVVVKTE